MLRALRAGEDRAGARNSERCFEPGMGSGKSSRNNGNLTSMEAKDLKFFRFRAVMLSNQWGFAIQIGHFFAGARNFLYKYDILANLQ